MAEAILRLLRLAEAIERPPEALAELCCKYPSKGALIYYVSIFSDIFGLFGHFLTFWEFWNICALVSFWTFLDFLRPFFASMDNFVYFRPF